MKVINIIQITLLSSLILGSVNPYSAKYYTNPAQANAPFAYAKVLYELPREKLKICASYIIRPRILELGAGFGKFTIELYEAQAKKLSNKTLVGFIECFTNKEKNHAHIGHLYVKEEFRQKRYGRLLSQLALQEFANQGFKKATLKPGGYEKVSTETLRNMYGAGGATSMGHEESGDMEIDISSLAPTRHKPFKDVFDQLFPPKAKL